MLPPASRSRAEELRAEVFAESANALARRIAAQSTGTVVAVAEMLTGPSGPVLASPASDPADSRPLAGGREPCSRCGIRGDLGCAHQQPALSPEPLEYRPDRPTHMLPTGQSACSGIEAEALDFIRRHDMTRSQFCAAIGQSSNSVNGFFVKAREGRLKPGTIARYRAFIQSYASKENAPC